MTHGSKAQGRTLRRLRVRARSTLYVRTYFGIFRVGGRK